MNTIKRKANGWKQWNCTETIYKEKQRKTKKEKGIKNESRPSYN
jgi:hypothetical protein